MLEENLPARAGQELRGRGAPSLKKFVRWAMDANRRRNRARLRRVTAAATAPDRDRPPNATDEAELDRLLGQD